MFYEGASNSIGQFYRDVPSALDIISKCDTSYILKVINRVDGILVGKRYSQYKQTVLAYTLIHWHQPILSQI